MRYGSENWPTSGPVWIRIVPDGSAAIGWRTEPYGLPAAKLIQEEAKPLIGKFSTMAIGETITVPVRYHHRHGAITETYVRAR